MTNNLKVRAWQHKQNIVKGFTSRYNLDKLVWYEEYQWVQDAIAREKEIKGWSRKKKIELIESMNPEWKDLYDTL
jgi:putative endonuclease